MAFRLSLHRSRFYPIVRTSLAESHNNISKDQAEEVSVFRRRFFVRGVVSKDGYSVIPGHANEGKITPLQQ